MTDEPDVGARAVCARCVMDTSDPEIWFDANGVCNHCLRYDELAAGELARDPLELEELVAAIKRDGARKDYDCVIGVSGGVDSTYVAYEVKRLGLRPLAVHLDNGWDSELAIHNIEQALRTLEIDLVTRVLDWDSFRRLQISFLRASVPDAEIPTDHAILAALYEEASRRRIRYILSGDNFATEAILPRRWTYGVHDWRYIDHVHRRFAGTSPAHFPHVSRLRLSYFRRRGIQVVKLLDHLRYVKGDAVELLRRELGWRPYGGKHYESIYTRFFQGYILPVKFGIDKRKAHLSTLICAGQLTREEALQELAESEYLDGGQAAEDRVYVVKKLGLTEAEFDEIMRAPARSYEDYPNHLNQPVWRLLRGLKRRLLGAARGRGAGEQSRARRPATTR